MNEDVKIKGSITVSVIRANGSEELICKDNPNLITKAGRDWIHSQLYNTVSGVSNFIGLSRNTDAPVDTDIILTDEITTGGLERHVGASTHVVGTNTTTVIFSFSATVPFTDVQKVGLFSAVSGGTLVHENNFSPVALSVTDELRITWTITAG